MDKTLEGEAGSATMGRSPSQMRNQPVKRYDGEPLTRVDVQHAMLCHLFADTRRVFTNPRPGARGAPLASIVQSVGAGTDESDADGRALAAAPPAVQATVAAAVAGPFATHVWPYGQAAGSARRGDETPAEYEAWRARRADYIAWRDANYPASVTPRAELPPDTPPSPWEHPGAEKLTFKELYIEALMNSSKCTKSMREKCFCDEEYAEDFSKVCLLVNVGRINTTLAFYPEMKTILRSYHPVPSLQRSENTRRNMQDAPRMKSLLKAVLLPHERPGPPGGSASASARHEVGADTEEVPSDLAEIARRLRRARHPPTSVVTLIFLLTQQAPDVTALHFPEPYDVHSLFFPQPGHMLGARERANAFLWLLYHYLEGPAARLPGEPGSENPFDDDTSRAARAAAAKALRTQGITLDDAHPLYRGTTNPAFQQWRRQHEPEGRRRSDDGPPCPEPYLDRVLVPALATLDAEAYAQEDRDPPEEIEWGRQMQQERSAFLQRFQEEEQARVLAQGSSVPEDEQREDKKKRPHVGTQSCYPLANILANAAAAGAQNGSHARSPIGFVKRARLSSRQLHAKDASRDSPSTSDAVGAAATDAAPPVPPVPSLWQLDLGVSAAQQQRSLLHDEWARLNATRDCDYDSDEETPQQADAGPLARTLLVLRRIREVRGDMHT